MESRVMDLPKFSAPFCAMIAAPTRGGKTVWAKHFVDHADQLISPPPEEIIWCFTEYQKGYQSLLENPKVRMVEGLPDIKQLKETSDKRKLLILDDLMMEGAKKGKGAQDLLTLFIRGAHHWSCSCLHIVQNAFYPSLRTIRLNSHYLILLKSPADGLQISHLARQMFPGRHDCMVEAYKDATMEKYGYLLIDLSQECPDELRLRSKIFPGDLPVVYLPK